MKITITPETGSPATLCDHGREGPSGFTIIPLRKVEALSFVQSSYGKPKNRGNTLLQLTFSVAREHSDYASAQLYLLMLDDTLPTDGTLRIEMDDQRSYAEAESATLEINPLPILGVKTTINYTIKFGAWCDVLGYVNLRDADGKLMFTADGKQIKVKEDII